MTAVRGANGEQPEPAAFVSDPDFTLLVGDALEVLRDLPDGSVHCCVTSPPYWGLRDYGTGTWEGGDPDCDHAAAILTRHGGWDGNNKNPDGTPRESRYAGTAGKVADTCKCGATRVDQQLGLEPTPDEYVANMVAVFREVRRVLRKDGTLWLNIGDSYVAGQGGRQSSVGEMPAAPLQRTNEPRERDDVDTGSWASRDVTAKMTPARGTTHLKPKDLVGIPWRLAFALQTDGWYLRSDIIWSKPNPMPESVTDRPTKAHEYLFLLTKSPRYFYDADAIREPSLDPADDLRRVRGDMGDYSRKHTQGGVSAFKTRNGDEVAARIALGRNKRSVWEIATAPYPEAHFATFPPALVEPCVKAGTSEHGCCPVCGAPWEREAERELVDVWHRNKRPTKAAFDLEAQAGGDQASRRARDGHVSGHSVKVTTTGWRSTCDHDQAPTACTVLDPFLGSGTTAQVARRLGRRSIGIELNAEYAELAARRLQQLSLFAEEPA